MDDTRINFQLIAAPADSPERSSEYQNALKEFANNLRILDKRVAVGMFTQDAVDASSFFTGSFSIAKSIGLGLVPVFVAWLSGRFGRKVRLKVKDVEVEASTVEEIEKLLALVAQLPPRTQGESSDSTES